MRPHICCYSVRNSKIVSESDPSSRVEFGYAELFIDVQPEPALDFFIDPPDDMEQYTRTRSYDFIQLSRDEEGYPILDLLKTLGQHIAYAAEICARQPRAFVFSISVAGSRGRLLRWDRSGCVASEAFDLHEQPDLLCEFLWRFSRTSCAGRGHDVSVQPATEEEEALFEDVVTRHVRSQLELDDEDRVKDAVAEHYKAGHVYAVDVEHQEPPADDERTRRFIISRPVVAPLSLVGRGTRGYWAADTTTRSVVFIKDSWRSCWSESLEAETQQHLSEIGVRFVPPVVWYGDVANPGTSGK